MTDASKTPMDHKYLNPECCEHGCQTLVLQNKIESITRQRDGLVKALEEVRKIARGETFTKGDCAAVNKCGAIADDALAAAAKETNERPV